MRLFIAEKPSLGRAIAAALPGAQKKEKTHIRCGEDIVVWAVGHIIELKNPDDYDPKYKKWSAEDLPIVPEVWGYKEKADTADLLKNIKDLLKKLKKTDTVINAGDADREGQTLIDEILEFYGYKGKTLRLLVTDTNPEAVKKALEVMKDNSEYETLYRAGQARAMSDWLLGLNMTRLYTVQAQKNGYSGTPISIGRVQTPVLGLIVRRDRDIMNFISKPYYRVSALLSLLSGSEFIANWRPKENQEGLDEEGRLVDSAVADELIEKIKNQDGKIIKVEKKKKSTAQPKPHTLPTLQIEASKKLGISPDETLKIAQNLYESGIITYPRSDCSYLPEAHHSEAAEILSSIRSNAEAEALNKAIDGADTNIKSGAWNDKNVSEHHAIIPTKKTARLEGSNRAIYELIALRYVSQFWAVHEYFETAVEVDIKDETFTAKGITVISNGWKDITSEAENEEQEKDKEDGKDGNSDDTRALPEGIAKGEAVTVKSADKKDRQTMPPKRFTEASIIQAMNGIHRFVENPEIKKMLKESDGLGTAATQADIIKKLFMRNYIEKKGKEVFSTEKGQKLIDVLPETVTQPDITALWEHRMKDIVSGSDTLQSFLSGVQETLAALIEAGKNSEIRFETEKSSSQSSPSHKNSEQKKESSANTSPCPNCKNPMNKINGKNGAFWACGKCALTLSDVKGKPQKTSKCKVCKTGIAKLIVGKNGEFWACQNPDCKKTSGK